MYVKNKKTLPRVINKVNEESMSYDNKKFVFLVCYSRISKIESKDRIIYIKINLYRSYLTKRGIQYFINIVNNIFKNIYHVDILSRNTLKIECKANHNILIILTLLRYIHENPFNQILGATIKQYKKNKEKGDFLSILASYHLVYFNSGHSLFLKTNNLIDKVTFDTQLSSVHNAFKITINPKLLLFKKDIYPCLDSLPLLKEIILNY